MLRASFALLPLLLAQLTPAAGEVARKQAITNQSVNAKSARLLFLRQSCSSGSLCGGGCIPASASCCDQSEGLSCPSGYYCDGVGIEQGCCETGQLCSGLGNECAGDGVRCGLDCLLPGTPCTSSGISVPTFSTAVPSATATSVPTGVSGTGSTCRAGTEACDGECMPIGSVCCGNGYYCDAGEVCLAGGRCQLAGAGGGSGGAFSSATSSSFSFTTPTTSSTSVRSIASGTTVVTPTAVSGGGGISSGSGSSESSSAAVGGGGQEAAAPRSFELAASPIVGGLMLVGIVVMAGL